MDEHFFPIWTGRFVGFLSALATRHEIPETTRQEIRQMVQDYDEALKKRHEKI